MGTLSGEVRTEVLCGRICDLEDENAKLLKLVRNLHACNGSCPRCIELMGKCEYEEQLAECGIEAGE